MLTQKKKILEDKNSLNVVFNGPITQDINGDKYFYVAVNLCCIPRTSNLTHLIDWGGGPQASDNFANTFENLYAQIFHKIIILYGLILV